MKVKVEVLVTQSRRTLCNPKGCRLLSQWGFSRQVGCHALLQGIFPTQESNPGLPHCGQILYCLSHQGSPCHIVYVLLLKIEPLYRYFIGNICLKYELTDLLKAAGQQFIRVVICSKFVLFPLESLACLCTSCLVSRADWFLPAVVLGCSVVGLLLNSARASKLEGRSRLRRSCPSPLCLPHISVSF